MSVRAEGAAPRKNSAASPDGGDAELERAFRKLEATASPPEHVRRGWRRHIAPGNVSAGRGLAAVKHAHTARVSAIVDAGDAAARARSECDDAEYRGDDALAAQLAAAADAATDAINKAAAANRAADAADAEAAELAHDVGDMYHAAEQPALIAVAEARAAAAARAAVAADSVAESAAAAALRLGMAAATPIIRKSCDLGTLEAADQPRFYLAATHARHAVAAADRHTNFARVQEARHAAAAARLLGSAGAAADLHRRRRPPPCRARLGGGPAPIEGSAAAALAAAVPTSAAAAMPGPVRWGAPRRSRAVRRPSRPRRRPPRSGPRLRPERCAAGRPAPVRMSYKRKTCAACTSGRVRSRPGRQCGRQCGGRHAGPC